MDGNLLDSESADTTLAKDWSLPVLPEGNSSLPSSSQELADIFGTSDDEDDIDFPFSLNTDLHVSKGYSDITLPEENTKSFGSSLLSNEDSGLFLSSFQPPVREGDRVTQANSLSAIEVNNIPVTPGSTPEINKESVVNKKSNDKEISPSTAQKVEGDSPESVAKDENKSGPNSSEKQSNSQDTPMEEVSSIEEKDEGSISQTQQLPSNPSPVRKSARLRARFDITDSSSGSSSEHETKKVVKLQTGDTTATVTEPHPETIEEENKVESSLKNEESSHTDKPDEPDTVGKEDVSLSKSGDGSDKDSGDETSEDESDDPDKLYCICREPHDDRFMICCDTCEDWFHGNCVGITVAQGKRMEREGKDYVCPLCLEKEQKTKEEREADRSTRQQNREVVRDKFIKKKLAGHIADDPKTTPPTQPQRKRTLSGSTPHHHPHTPTTPTDSDAYGLAQLFIPDNAPKGASTMGEVSSTTEQGGVVKTEDSNLHSNELLQHKCMIPDCLNVAFPPAIYCGQPCIEKHVALSLKQLANRGVSIQSNPSEFVRGSGGIGVIDKSTNKIMVGICAPSEKELIPWLQMHPSYQVLIHRKGGSKGKSKNPKVKHESKKDPGSPTKYPKIALMDPDSVRANAKRALYQILWKRHENAPDLSDLDQAEVEKVAHDIEEKLFNLYRDISPKYKNKYRSLIFNLKDTKNQGLFRKVLRKKISTKELVRMSTEKLASDDLAAWREHTLKKNLEMIKQREEEAGALGEVIRKVTHKGEVEIDSSAIDDTVAQSVPTSEKSDPEGDDHEKSNASGQKPHSQTKVSKSASKTTDNKNSHKDGGILDLLTNTTPQHGSHVYDQHCDICTGKVKPPSTPPQTSPDSRMEDSTMTETTEHTSPDSAAKPPSPYSPIFSSDKAIWKGFVSMIGLAKFAATAYPVSGLSDDLFEVLPNTLHVKGRIAHVQVWDYLDKLRSSASREIVVIQFGWQEEDKDAYVSMFNYLVRKHRCGVITSCHEGIKDMYLVPLPSHRDVPQQLLPFSGPGLPVDRADVLLGVIVSNKLQKHHHRHLQDTPSPVTHIRAEVTLKRHHSTGDEGNSGELRKKRIRFQTEVGFGGQTPPSGSRQGVGSSFTTKTDPADDDESAPYSPSNLLDDVDALDSKSKGLSKPRGTNSEERTQPHEGVQMSFYGEHRTLSSVSSDSSQPPNSSGSSDSSSKVAGTTSIEEISTSAMAASLKATLNLPPATDIKNILAQLSSDKLKELASAVSSLEKISEGGPVLDPSLIPGKEVVAADLQHVSNTSQEPTTTPSVPPVSLPMSFSDTPQKSVTQSDSTVTASSFHSVSTQMTNHSPTVLQSSQQYTMNAQQQPLDTDPPSQLIHGQMQEHIYQAQGSQPQVHQAQGSQPQVHQAQGSQPQVHQAQGSQPQVHQAPGSQPQVHQVQSSPPQLHDSQTHPVQYNTGSQQMQQSSDTADNFNQWDHRQDHHPAYNPPSQPYNQYQQHSLEGQQGFQQQPNYQQPEYQPQQTPDLSHGANDSDPNYPSQPMYSHPPHQAPPSQDDTTYQQQGQYAGHSWQDPRSAHQHSQWGHQEQQQQQQYAREHMPYNEPRYEDHGSSEGFRGQPNMGFRGGRGYRGHGFRGGRRGRWLGDGRHMDRGGRYRGYRGRGRDI